MLGLSTYCSVPLDKITSFVELNCKLQCSGVEDKSSQRSRIQNSCCCHCGANFLFVYATSLNLQSYSIMLTMQKEHLRRKRNNETHVVNSCWVSNCLLFSKYFLAMSIGLSKKSNDVSCQQCNVFLIRLCNFKISIRLQQFMFWSLLL